jgi:hypothetical protein
MKYWWVLYELQGLGRRVGLVNENGLILGGQLAICSSGMHFFISFPLETDFFFRNF